MKIRKKEHHLLNLFFVFHLAFCVYFWSENTYLGELAREERRGIVCTSYTSPQLGLFAHLNLRFSSTLVMYSHMQ